jgi:hypothetical protein
MEHRDAATVHSELEVALAIPGVKHDLVVINEKGR